MKTKKLREIFGDKPDHFRGTKKQWTQLFKAMVAHPDKNYDPYAGYRSI